MSLFFLLFFALYATMHAYVLFRIRDGLSLSRRPTVIVGAVFLLLSLTPVAVFRLSTDGPDTVARAVAFGAYSWMGFVFLLVCANLAFDALDLLLRLANTARGKGRARVLNFGPAAFALTFGFALLASVYAFVEATDIATNRVVVESTKLPIGVARLRIAQVSDVHLGLIHRHDTARKVAEIVSAERPDLFVATGDFVDGNLEHLTGLAEIFAATYAPLGKFACLGNHEYYVGVDRSIAFTKAAGFTLLRDEAVDVGESLRIAGADDRPARDRFNLAKVATEESVVGATSTRYTVLLKHRPEIGAAAGRFDLQLSGHTHHGQIFPFRLLTKIAYPLLGGLHPVPGGGTLFVSRGTGTWGPPMRFLSQPEVTIIDIVRPSSTSSKLDATRSPTDLPPTQEPT